MLGQLYYLDEEPAPWMVYATLRGVNAGEEGRALLPSSRGCSSNTATLLSLMVEPPGQTGMPLRAIAMAARGHYSAAAHVVNINGIIRPARKWASARRRKALALIRELGDYNVEPEVHLVTSTMSLIEGRLTAAAPALVRLRELAERNGNAQILCWTLAHQVVTLLGRGEDVSAAAVLEEALAVPTSPKDGTSRIEKQRALMLTRLRQGRDADAVVAADAIVEMIVRQPPVGYHFVDYFASAIEVSGGARARNGLRADEQRIARASRSHEFSASATAFSELLERPPYRLAA
jgi:hypothetical protein